MKLFTKMSSWLLLAVMGLVIVPNATFAQNKQDVEPIQIAKTYEVGKSEAFTLVLWDSFGDGWDGASMDVFVNGGMIYDDITVPSDGGWGNGGIPHEFPVDVEEGDLVETVYTSGSWESEHTYAFYDHFGTLVDGDGPAPGPGISFTVVFPSPKLAVAPTSLDLGEWPIGGWQEMSYLDVYNDGTGTVAWTASELDDPDGLFALMNPSLPMDLVEGGTPAMVGVSFVGDGVAEDMYMTTYVASWGAGKSVTTADVMVSAYDAPEGDIVENPFMVTLPYMAAGESSAFPMRSNYNIPGTATNGKDVVYMFTLAEDKELNVTITNATETPKMAIYAAGFEGEGGPMVSNATATAGATATNVPLFAGDYYLVVSAESDDAAMTFDLDISATTMPDPECVMNPMPADGEIDVPSNGIVLEWTFGQYNQEYQVSYGTQYPPTDFTSAWMPAGAAGDVGTFALPNLDPSMQYFWMVSVMNNNATVTTCDVYGFTTTITPPSNLTALVVENAQDDYDVQLSWTSSAKSLLGYNVYRSDDGATYNMINASIVTTNSYTDEDLAYNTNPCYEYYVEAIFDEGVSDESNHATACITGVGTLNGEVTALLSGNPLIGANVRIESETGGVSYDLTTGGVGEYSAEVLEDCYTMTVSMEGYITEVRTGVCVDYNTTVTEDFELDEYPYPVSDVVAEELDESTVQVDWGNNGGPGEETVFRYDDGVSTGQLGSSTGTTNTLLGNVHRVDAELSQMSWYLTGEGGPHTTISIYVLGLDADGIPDGTNVLFTESVSNVDDSWNTFTFDTPIDATGGFFLGVGYNGFAAIGTDDGVDDPYAFVPNTQYFVGDYTAGGWDVWETFGFEVNGMIRAMGVPNGKASYAVTTPQNNKNADLELIKSSTPVLTGGPNWNVNSEKGAKELLGYNVWRGSCYSDDPADFEFLGYTLDDQFTDNNWGDVDWGVYKWAVEAVYTNNVSEMAFSNCLDKDMEAVVNVEVTTNSGDAPEGCEIMFMNTSEPDMMLTYEIELDASGMGSVEPFRKGVYDYMVVLPGFGEISATGVLVDSDTTFVWQLEELLAPPSDLYVTPTGFATWTGGGALPFEPVFEDFEEGLPEDWTITTNSSLGWFFATSVSSGFWSIPAGDGTFAATNDDDANDDGSVDYLISPLLDFSNNEEPFVTFSSFFDGAWGHTAFVEVSVDGGAWEVVHTMVAVGSWTEVQVDLAAYAGESDVLVAFHSDDNGGWTSGWGVDNVAITEGAGKYSTKGFQFFKIWHDEVFSNDVDTNFYQYGTNTEVDILVPGETYLAEVASLYSTGLSAKSEYEWTYLPCDSFPSWTIYEAYNIDDSDDNLVAWSDNVFFTPIEEDFEAGLPEGWSTSTNSAVGWFFTTDGSSGWWPIPAGDGQYACSNDDEANDDGSMDYLITPEMSFVGLSSVSLSFSSFLDGAYGQTGSVEVSMDGTTWTVVEDIATADSWTNVQVDLSAYVGSESIWVAFHSNDNGGWASGWAVDNVSIAPSKAGKADAMVIGTNVYRDGEMIAYVPEPDTFYLDMDLMPGYYDYCVTKVYSADEGLHTWTSCEMATCVEDVLVPEDCYAPENLTAEDLLGDGYTATLNWEFGGADVQEFLYDDGVSTGQLGSSTGTTNTLLGNLHTVDAELTEMSWYLTSEGGPHTTISIYVLGLDGSGIPDGNNVLFTESVSNTDDTWNTFTFDSPIDAAGGFFLGVGYNGFAAIGTDDGVGDPYTFVPNTHYFVGDYTAGGWETWETYGFNVNGMIRAMGVPGGKASYAASTVTTEPTGDLELVASAPVLTGTPNWTAEPASKEFVGFNVYRDGDVIATDITETTYLDDLGSYMGEVCYEVTAVYSVCGESDPSNEACVSPGVGIGEMDNNINVYPNPAKDYVMVEASTDIRSIEVTNYMGQVVSAVKSVEMTQHRINTSDLSSGVYFVEVETAAGIETIRIVISE